MQLSRVFAEVALRQVRFRVFRRRPVQNQNESDPRASRRGENELLRYRQTLLLFCCVFVFGFRRVYMLSIQQST